MNSEELKKYTEIRPCRYEPYPTLNEISKILRNKGINIYCDNGIMIIEDHNEMRGYIPMSIATRKPIRDMGMFGEGYYLLEEPSSSFL